MAELSLVGALSFDPAEVHVQHVREGYTVLELVAIAMPGAPIDQMDRAVVYLERDGRTAEIRRRRWHAVRPTAGTTIRVHAVGQNGAMRAVASLAILAAAALLAPYALGLLAPLGIQATAQTLAIAIGVLSAAGQALLNALVPLANKGEDESEQRYSITGTRNRANLWGPVPAVLGDLRVTPPYASLPYTTIEGGYQFLHASFAVAQGKTDLWEPRIGDTDIGEFKDVTIEIRNGEPGDAPLTVVEECVFEKGLSIELDHEDGWSVRRTASRVESISIDLYFPGGLFWVDSDQDIREMYVDVEVQYRRRGRGSIPHGDWVSVAYMYIPAATKEPFWHTKRWAVDGEPGTFDVRTRRASPNSEDADTTDTVLWSVLRSFRHQYPIQFPEPLALIGVKIRGSKQLNGTLNEFNVRAVSVVPDRDAEATTWSPRASNKPASLYRHVLTGAATARARTPSQLDNDNLVDWHGWAAGKALTYNRYHDFDASTREVLAAIGAAGRAAPSQSNGLWGVVIDRPQTVIRGHITPRNAYKLSGEPIYRKLPDAWRMPYLDEDDDHKPAELIVPRPGLVGPPLLFEELTIPGITNYSQLWREGRRRFAELELRFEDFMATQDIEFLFSPRGSLVQLSFPVLSERMVSARVKQVQSGTINGTPATLVLLDDQVTMVADASYACRFQKSDGSSRLWTLVTRPGTSRTLRLASGTTLPAIGDLAMFGLAGFDSADCIVKSIEPAKGPAGRLHLVRHAPEIEAIADDGAVPTRVVTPTEPAWSTRTPAVPIVVDARSGSDAVILGETGSPMIVHVRPGAGTVPVDHYVVTARRGAEPPIDVTVPDNSGRALFGDFSVGDVISITAVAVSAYGLTSAASAPIEHTITARRDVPADLVDLSAETFSSGLRRFDWSFDPTATADQVDRIASYRLRMRPGSGWTWAEMATGTDIVASTQPFDTPMPPTTGPHTIGIVAVDRVGRLSVNPATVDVTLAATSADVLASRIESVLGWDGTLASGTVETGGLEGTGSPSTIAYTLPPIDLDADLSVEVRAAAFGVAGAALILMTTGLAADGAPVGAARAPGIVTARYVSLTITVTHPDALATLGDLVSVITSA